MNVYLEGDLVEGMIIQAIVDDEDYGITKDNLYEISNVALIITTETVDYRIMISHINFINDHSCSITKQVNSDRMYAFEKFFKIVEE